MRSTVTVSLPGKMAKDLDALAKKRGLTRSQVIQESLRTMLFNSYLDDFRSWAVPHARAMGIYSDEDVFKIVS